MEHFLKWIALIKTLPLSKIFKIEFYFNFFLYTVDEEIFEMWSHIVNLVAWSDLIFIWHINLYTLHYIINKNYYFGLVIIGNITTYMRQ